MGCFKFAVQVSLVPAILSIVVHVTDSEYEYLENIVPADSVYNNLRTLISLCIVFHTVQSYNRFMGGLTLVYQLLGDLHETVSLLVTFSVHTKGTDETKKRGFQNTLVRLCSMMFALCIAELEAGDDDAEQSDQKQALSYNLIDPEGLDRNTLSLVMQAKDRPICVYQRLLDLMMDAFSKGVIGAPAPLFTRCFQELGNAMIKYHECLKFKDAPFPFPFMVITDTLLVVYTITTPFMYAKWCRTAAMGGILTFVTILCVWLLHCVADELDNPFGYDAADLKAGQLTADLNHQLLVLLANSNLPAAQESEVAVKNMNVTDQDSLCCESFATVLSKITNRATRDPDGQAAIDLEMGVDLLSPASAQSQHPSASSEEPRPPPDRQVEPCPPPDRPIQQSQFIQSHSASPSKEPAQASSHLTEPPRTSPPAGTQTSQSNSNRGRPIGNSHGQQVAEDQKCRPEAVVKPARAPTAGHETNDLKSIVVELADPKLPTSTSELRPDASHRDNPNLLSI